MNQSLIKELTSYGMCPRKVKAYYVDNECESDPSIYMFRGIYFEYKILGNLPKSGEVPIYPLLKRGRYEIHKQRIDEQIENFPKILEKEGIQIIDGQQEIEYKYDDLLTLFITIDSLALYKGRLCVMDIKLTLDLNSTFGKISWGNYDQMDKLQAYMYAYVVSKVLGDDVGFLYAVFDYKKSEREYRIFYEGLDDFKKRIMFERINKAEAIYQNIRQRGWKPKPSEETCKNCKVKNCDARFRYEQAPVLDEKALMKERKPVALIEDLLEFMMD
ncbi:hypothetical protein [Mongoliitalea daihaiensis]|uniref:hypothetical protein n=1 Tax=Mongoliitalea daihaiensis TaxID=2782006 RepID=UPI001F224F7B|nr:hypothetical protein [Mongoliitalea daihaiensis]UJP63966.1 hypothetical protein IPZ59_14200 [Mongoliitalea daihaiensis]